MTSEYAEPAIRRTVLVVDDDVEALRSLNVLLSPLFEVKSAASGEAALQIIKESNPDVVLMDITMQGISGLEVLELVRQEPKTKNLPIILVTGHAANEDVVAGLQKGASDYVTKPVNPDILIARIQANLRVAQLVRELQETNELLSTLATVDELTGLPNRRALQKDIETEFKRSLRYSRPLSILMLDIDKFSEANRSFGHSGGDSILRQIVTCVQGSLRITDILCRYAGEEFCAILPETDSASALGVAARIRDSVEQCSFQVSGEYTFFTVSIGLSSLEIGRHVHFIQLLDEAGRAMYQAKAAGGNTVHIFDASSTPLQRGAEK
jgi:diguanylate cyclase (GGDEF)-like protein